MISMPTSSACSEGPRDVDFDVGANVGQTLSSSRRAWPQSRVVCFEPPSKPLAELRRLVDADSLAEAHQIALSDVEGDLELHEFEVSAANSLLNPVIDASSPDFLRLGTISLVRATTLDAWCSRHSVDKIDLLKIDTQGADGRVLAGADGLLRAKDRPRVRRGHLRQSLRRAADFREL